jgi:hypothetical protein
MLSSSSIIEIIKKGEKEEREVRENNEEKDPSEGIKAKKANNEIKASEDMVAEGRVMNEASEVTVASDSTETSVDRSPKKQNT